MAQTGINKIIYNIERGADLSQTTANRFNGIAASQLNILENFMSFQKLKQGVRRISLAGGVRIKCAISFGLRTAVISIPSVYSKVEEVTDLIESGEYALIVCDSSNLPWYMAVHIPPSFPCVLVWDIANNIAVSGFPCGITDDIYLNWLDTVDSVGDFLFNPTLQGDNGYGNHIDYTEPEPCSCVFSSGMNSTPSGCVSASGGIADDFIFNWEVNMCSGGDDCGEDWGQSLITDVSHSVIPVSDIIYHESLRLEFLNDCEGSVALNVALQRDSVGGYYTHTTDTETYEILSPLGSLGSISGETDYYYASDEGTKTYYRLEQGFAGSFSKKSLCQIYYSIKNKEWRSYKSDYVWHSSDIDFTLFASCQSTDGFLSNPVNEPRNTDFETALKDLLLLESQGVSYVREYSISEHCPEDQITAYLEYYNLARFSMNIYATKEIEL